MKDDKQTYHSRAQADVEAELGGRFAKPKPLIGGSVPMQPEGSPWASDPVGQEPPLGFSVEAMEPVGNPHEIERSLRAMDQQQETEQNDEGQHLEGPQ
jgi:hypothetical protein